MLPLVSILIPAYNAQGWIAETIQSSLAQTWQRKEIIIVDDGSTDATLNIVRRYKSPMLKVIHQENRGACQARNRALEECQGDYIQWLDADDLLNPDKIERQMTAAIDLDDPYVLLSSAWGKFYFMPSRAKFRPTPLWSDFEPVDWLVLRMANPWMFPPMVWLVSRRLTDKAGLWDERLARNQDGEYFCRLVSLSRYVKFVHESRCYYRMSNPSSVSHSNSRKAWESIYLSIKLEIHYVLTREDSERTRAACVRRLNAAVAILNDHAPDLANRLRQRINKMGGMVVPESNSMKYAIIKGIIGENNAWLLKGALSRTHRRISCNYERWLTKVFGANL